MSPPKIPYLLFERGRYYYQRKVPLDFHDVIGIKKWREPVGADPLSAVDRVRTLAKEHDALLSLLKDPEERRDHKAQARRSQERSLKAREAEEDSTYRNWLLENGTEDPVFFGEDPFSQAMQAKVNACPWASAKDWIKGLESERSVAADLQMFEHWISRLQQSEKIGFQLTELWGNLGDGVI
jgi:hypothetical protein